MKSANKNFNKPLCRLAFALIVTLLFSCSSNKVSIIAGEWSEIDGNRKIKFFKNSWVSIGNYEELLQGYYESVGKDRIKLILLSTSGPGAIGTLMKAIVAKVFISGDELTVTMPDGDISKYLFGEKKTKKPEYGEEGKVKIRLIYEKELVKKPIEIILADCSIKYSRKVIKDQMIYFFNDVSPGEYLIGLTFNENIDGQLTKKTYGLNPWNLYSINVDTKGKWYSDNGVLKDSEIEVQDHSSVQVDLLFSSEFVNGIGTNLLTVEFHKELSKEKSEKIFYYKIRVIRFFKKK